MMDFTFRLTTSAAMREVLDAAKSRADALALAQKATAAMFEIANANGGRVTALHYRRAIQEDGTIRGEGEGELVDIVACDLRPGVKTRSFTYDKPTQAQPNEQASAFDLNYVAMCQVADHADHVWKERLDAGRDDLARFLAEHFR